MGDREGCTVGICIASRCGSMNVFDKWLTFWAKFGARGMHPLMPEPRWLRMQIVCCDHSWTSWMASE